MSDTEEQRAADYRASQLARLSGRMSLYALLRGSTSARAALRTRWAPLIDPDPGFDPPDFDDIRVGPESN